MALLNNLSIIGLAVIAIAAVIFATLFFGFRIWNRQWRGLWDQYLASDQDQTLLKAAKSAEKRYDRLAGSANIATIGMLVLAGSGLALYLVARVVISYTI